MSFFRLELIHVYIKKLKYTATLVNKFINFLIYNLLSDFIKFFEK
jgi:hypothetical protein